MDEDVYEKLAQKLGSFPSGFPRTESGIEIRLLKKIFLPEEAALMIEMMPMPETAAQIAGRTGRNPQQTLQLLLTMLQKGQIHGFPMGEEFAFVPLPFIVGIYFFHSPYVDKELADLFEEYYRSWAEGSLNIKPTYFRVISVDKSIPLEFEVFPYERAETILKDANSFGLFPCMCKLQKQLVDDSCKHPTNTCLVFSQASKAFDNIPSIQSISREEAFKALRDFEDAGLVHTMGNFRETNPGMDFICSCCTCGCTFLRGLAELGIENSVAKTNFMAVVKEEACDGCGTCIDRCQFKAIAMKDDVLYVNNKRCAGCGLCVITCPSEALSLERRPEDETVQPPRDIQEWNQVRAQNRQI